MKALEQNFDVIYKNYYEKILLFIYSVSADWTLAEDITQEAFLKAYKNIGSLREESKLPVWLNKIAYNLFRDHMRRKSKKLLSIDDELLLSRLSDLKRSIVTETEQKIMSECIQNKLMLLPENYRLALLLDAQGYSNPEKAGIMGCSLENTKIRLHRARKKIKEVLGRDCTFYYDERNVFC